MENTVSQQAQYWDQYAHEENPTERNARELALKARRQTKQRGTKKTCKDCGIKTPQFLEVARTKVLKTTLDEVFAGFEQNYDVYCRPCYFKLLDD